MQLDSDAPHHRCTLHYHCLAAGAARLTCLPPRTQSPCLLHLRPGDRKRNHSGEMIPPASTHRDTRIYPYPCKLNLTYYSLRCPGNTIVGGRCVTGARRAAVERRAFCWRTWLWGVSVLLTRLRLKGYALHDGNGGHGLHNGDGTGEHTGIVATASGERTGGSVVLGSLLLLRDGGRGLEADTERGQPRARHGPCRRGECGASCSPRWARNPNPTHRK